MANNKQIVMDYSATGLTVYCVVRREADDYLLDDSDGNFAAAPADYFNEMLESLAIAGRYELDESRQVWDNGLYTVCIYRQVGAEPFPAADTMIGDGEMVIQDDTEISNFLSSIPWSGTTTVQQLIDQILPRLSGVTGPGISFINGINALSNLIFKRLWKRHSEIVTSEVTILFAAGVPAMAVPPAFFGLKSQPQISTGVLDKLDPRDKFAYHNMTGVPKVYELRQNVLYVYPTPTVNTAVKMEYFRNPGTVDTFDDVVPFTGLFNQVYIEGMIHFAKTGSTFIQDAAFAKFLDDEIESVLPARNVPLRTRRTLNTF